MSTEEIILFPTTHEQSLPTFHVHENLFPKFVEFLKRAGFHIAEPPEKISEKHIFEVLLEAETPFDELQAAKDKFLTLVKS